MMRLHPKARGWLLLSLLLIAIQLAACQARPTETSAPTATPISVYRYENPNALDMVYPIGWEFSVVTEGVLLFGAPDAIALKPGSASLVVFRQSPLAAPPALQDAMHSYLERGPLQTGYHESSDMAASQLGGQAALEVFVEAAADAKKEAPPMRAFVIGAHVDRGAFYVLSATAQ